MPSFGFRTAHKTRRSGIGAIPARLSEFGKAMSDLAASIVRGLGPAPVLQPIPVRVRDRRQYRG